MTIFSKPWKQVAAVTNGTGLRDHLAIHGNVNAPHLVISLFDVLALGMKWMSKSKQASLFVASGNDLRALVEADVCGAIQHVLQYLRQTLSPDDNNLSEDRRLRMTIVLKEENASHEQLTALSKVNYLCDHSFGGGV
jgi:hypothetical protein